MKGRSQPAQVWGVDMEDDGKEDPGLAAVEEDRIRSGRQWDGK